jgi:quercetin dioxygenase-like cupin family protein
LTIFVRNPFELHVPDLAVASDDVPWVPRPGGGEFKPLQFQASTGSWANLVRLEPGHRIARHLHAGGCVHAFVLEGAWHYLERDWVASKGSYVWEPPGDVHTLEVVSDEPMVTLFIVSGVIQYLDDDGNVVVQDDMATRRELYEQHCREHGIEPLALTV